MADTSGLSESSQEQNSASTVASGVSTAVPGDRVPHQKRVPSTSQVTVQSIPQDETEKETLPSYHYQLKAVIESQQALIESQHRTIENQRQEIARQLRLFADERRLWQAWMENFASQNTRSQTRIRFASAETSPASLDRPATAEQKGGLWTPIKSKDASESASRQSLMGNAPIWNPRPDHKPTRVFKDEFKENASDAKAASKSHGQVDENTKKRETTSPSKAYFGDSTITGNFHERPSIPGHLISKNYDGIMLKRAGLVTDEAERLATLQAGSSVPPKKQSPRELSQVLSISETSNHGRLSLTNEIDPTLRDAGHTPMARGSLSKLTSLDGTTSGGDSGSTPRAEVERPPLYPPTTLQEPITQPRNPDVNFQPETPDQDMPLDGPLGLTNSPDNERNKVFLGALDKKLSRVSLKEAAGNIEPPSSSLPSGDPSKSSSGSADSDLKNVDGSPCEDPETEPPLRIKKSVNFGSALGRGEEVDYGKGFAKRDA